MGGGLGRFGQSHKSGHGAVEIFLVDVADFESLNGPNVDASFFFLHFKTPATVGWRCATMEDSVATSNGEPSVTRPTISKSW
ncbi:MAG: hypothetical protein RL691_438 [Actinomycetota bacterium]